MVAVRRILNLSQIPITRMDDDSVYDKDFNYRNRKETWNLFIEPKANIEEQTCED